jgi:hypothetical protein
MHNGAFIVGGLFDLTISCLFPAIRSEFRTFIFHNAIAKMFSSCECIHVGL